jgi:tetratricopeptide (TPR) repeat protein
MGRAQLAFSILAIFIVFSMVAGTVAYAILEVTANEPPDASESEGPDGQSNLEAEARAAVEERPDDPQALANLANLLANLGKAEESIAWYERALALTPDDPAVRFDFAQTLVQAGKPNDAELQFQKVIALEPENPYAHYYLAELYRSWAPPRTEEAIAEYRKVIDVGPDTYVADESRQQLVAMGAATPTGSPTTASPTAEESS